MEPQSNRNETAGEVIRTEIISLLAEIASHLYHKLEDIMDIVPSIEPKSKDKSIQFCMHTEMSSRAPLKSRMSVNPRE